MEFDWDAHNEEHIARHHVTADEAEEAVLDPSRVPFTAHRGPHGQRRAALVGATEAGRLLFVVLEKRGQAFRVVTARDAQPSEKRRYRR